MIYLILKMFLYLLLALIAGAGAGWMLRHLAAARQEEDVQRTLADARARVPQFESLIRSRDEQINRLKEDLKEKDGRINGLVAEVREAEKALREKTRELRTLIAQKETLKELSGAGAPVDGDSGDGTSSETVARLERELAKAKSQAADAMAEAASAEAEVITLKAQLARAGEGTAGGGVNVETVAELEKRLAQKTMDQERLARDLELEQRRVAELERERQLQNKSLRVLHQQLELERERGQRVASG